MDKSRRLLYIRLYQILLFIRIIFIAGDPHKSAFIVVNGQKTLRLTVWKTESLDQFPILSTFSFPVVLL